MNTYGLIGKKLSHSFSAQYFNSKFEKEALHSIYKLFEMEDISLISKLLQSEPTLKGFNVTIPFKEKILPYLDAYSKTAEEIGAVNTVKIKEGKLYGYNTDVIGFEQLLKPLLNNRPIKALVLGNGGAAKAVVYVLKQLDIPYQIVSRTPENGDITWEEINPRHLSEHKLLINTTPLGMYPKIDASPALPYEAVTSHHIAIDLIYNPEKTVFMEKCLQQKAVATNGIKMLYAQAEAAWDIWQEII